MHKLKISDRIIWFVNLPRSVEGIICDIKVADGFFSPVRHLGNRISIKHKTYSSKLFRTLWGVELG
jgi:hypothetical protein